MAKYRKKPVVVEAFKWQTDNVPQWWISRKDTTIDVNSGSAFITTLEGIHEARVGDFIIKGIKGEIYPCKPDVFEATYEEVKDVI